MDSSRNRQNRARQRHEERTRRREMVSVPERPAAPRQRPQVPYRQFVVQARDFLWYLRHHTPAFKIAGGLVAVIFALFVLGTIFSPQVGYNVWALGVPLSGLSLDDAQAALRKAWDEQIRIDVVLEGQTLKQVSPAEMGLRLDAGTMAQNAMDVRWQGFPMGYEIPAIIETDYSTAQNLLLSLVDTVYIPPYDAGFEWKDNQVVAVPGRASRELEVMLVLENILQSAETIVRTRRLNLITSTTAPASMDSTALLGPAADFINGNFRIVGYDPFTDQSVPWTSTREEIARWIAAGANGLTVRESAFKQFLEAINSGLRAEEKPRYLDIQEAIAQLRSALAQQHDTAYLRIRYAPRTLTLQAGDWGQRIARRMGMPFNLIEGVNPSVNWNQVYVGDVINLPSPDPLLPKEPVPNKRIIVDLDRRYLVAYENGEVIMSWRVSIGQDAAPTIPGVFQVLSHAEKAYGSGFSLCGDAGCAQWEMDWFMGIYEVTPGLMNGFHGAVLLPNGAYLDGGALGNKSTFGCVMANNEEAKRLYEWAEVGTIVEIISSDYPPQSRLGQQAMEYISQTYGV
jgi:hypothetical protein